MFVIPKHFKATKNDGISEKFFSEADAKNYAGENGTTEVVEADAILNHINESQPRQVVLKKLYAALPPEKVFTEKGKHLIITLIDHKGQEFAAELLNRKLQDVDLTTRLANNLWNAKLYTMTDVASVTQNGMLKYRNFGKKCLVELETLLHNEGLDFGMFEEEK